MHEASIANIPHQDVKLGLDDPPTQDEVRSAIAKIKCHKAPGIVGLPAEVYTLLGGDLLLEKLTNLFSLCWEKGEVQKDLRDAVIVSLY